MFLKVLVCTLALWGVAFSKLWSLECTSRKTIRRVEENNFACEGYTDISEACTWIDGTKDPKSFNYYYSCFENGQVVSGIIWHEKESHYLVKCCVFGRRIRAPASKLLSIPLTQLNIKQRTDILCGVVRDRDPQFKQQPYGKLEYQFQICEIY